MALYTVQASYTVYLSVDVEANSESEAYDIAKQLDGGDFTIHTLGDWEIGDISFQTKGIHELLERA